MYEHIDEGKQYGVLEIRKSQAKQKWYSKIKEKTSGAEIEVRKEAEERRNVPPPPVREPAPEFDDELPF
jgi:hypothetical protein